MTAKNTVKMYGRWFKAGEEIGVEFSTPFSSESIESQKIQNEYTKTEINRMTTAELRETAKGEGIAIQHKVSFALSMSP